MKKLLVLAWLAGCAASCKKGEGSPVPPAVLAAQINGQTWEADAQNAPRTGVTDSYAFKPVRYIFSVEGRSQQGVAGLKLSRLQFNISFSYLPKIGRHAINSGTSNAKQNYCGAYFYFDAPDGVTYRAQATAGHVDITEIANGYIGGTFELTCPAVNMPATSGAPAVFTFTKGRFYDLTNGPFGQTLIWDGEQ